MKTEAALPANKITMLNTLAESEAFKALAAEVRAKEMVERQRMVAQLTELRAKLPPVAAEMAERVATAKRRVDEARDTLKAAEADLAEAQRADWSATVPIENRIRAAERQLIEASPPEVAEFIADVRGLVDQARGQARSWSRFSAPNWLTGHRREIVMTNTPAIAAFVEKAISAIARAEAMQLEAIADPVEELDRMKAELVVASRGLDAEEFVGDAKPYPDFVPAPPAPKSRRTQRFL